MYYKGVVWCFFVQRKGHKQWLCLFCSFCMFCLLFYVAKKSDVCLSIHSVIIAAAAQYFALRW